MAGELQTTITFANGEQVTSAKLNEIISGASFTADAVTGPTLTVVGGKLKVGTITSSELGSSSVTNTALAADSVTTTKILDGAVSFTKILDGAVAFIKLATSAVGTKAQLQSEITEKLVAADMAKYSPGAAKAYGTVSVTDATRVVTGGYNAASATKLSTTETRVTFTNAMANANYSVHVSAGWGGASTANVTISGRTTTTFDFTHPAEGTGPSYVMFTVHGTLA